LTGDNTSTTSGVVLFSTTTGANGNDNNTIDNCDIRDGATTPNNGIFSSGTTTSTATNNSGNTISNNNIFNYFAAASTSAGVLISSGSTDWTISGNSFYQTATRTSTAAATVYGISIANSTSGNNFVVSSNFIGGSTASAGGTAWTIAGAFANRFNGIGLNVSTTNLHISAGSPMIDTAVTIPSVNSDFDGQTRPIGAANDIGADEWVATITISGRVLTSDGQGIKNVLVSLTDSGAGPKRSTLTGPFGYYSFTGQPSNLVYTVTVGSKRFTFTPNFRDVGGYADITNFDFTADPLP